MNKIAGNFMKAGVIYALFGFALGIAMAASHSFAMKSVHTHINLIGWATMAIYAMYYQLVPEASETGLAKAHFWLANLGFIILTAGVALMAAGMPQAEPGAAVGSLVTLVSLILFTYIVFRSAGEARQRAGA